MGRTASHPHTDTERASRMRDNKRRHRARQKEYVLDLERRVAEARNQGVQATKEVQLAAQRVAHENAKLRDLLRSIGYTEEAVDAWVRGENCLQRGERHQFVMESTAEKSSQREAPSCESRTRKKLASLNIGAKEKESTPMKTGQNKECSVKASPLARTHDTKSEASSAKVRGGTCAKSPFLPPPVSGSTGAPCKILSLLAENPAADITQQPLATESNGQPSKSDKPGHCSSDGVECSTAYKMLMRYATSDEKMDKFAAALEGGCVPSGSGGCSVKKSVVWRMLDEECV